MTSAIRHRGPDDQGILCLAEDGVALGMRRLSVVDIVGGRQPMWSDDRRSVLVYNGELYNAGELRAELRAAGRRFATDHSDTEVLANGYAEWGPGVFKRLNGMFAVAIWDLDRRALVVARDPVGEKPLYVARAGGGYAIASELKSLMAIPEMDRTLDPAALEQYFSFDYIIGPRSPFAAVQKLPAGHFATITSAGYETERYWRPELDPERRRGPESDQELDELLRDAVRRRMVADVPIGLFLSGGLDSTAVGYYMRQESDDVHSFSIGFQESSHDESAYAQAAADALGTHHNVEVFSTDQLAELVFGLAEVLDEPMGDQSILPTMLLSRFTREQVTVALGGDGSDEIFMGYGGYKIQKAGWQLDRVPGLSRAIGGLGGALPQAIMGRGAKGLEVARAMRLDAGSDRLLATQAAFGGLGRGVLSAELRAQLPESVFAEPRAAILAQSDRRLNGGDATVAAYLRGYLQEDILVKVDRASMAASLEVRAPFLDPRVVDFALSIPLHERMRRFTGKLPLRRLMRGRIPDAIIDRTKQGFGVPINPWLRGSLSELSRELLDPARIRREGVLDPEAVSQIARAHAAGADRLGDQLWLLLLFQLWHRRWIGDV